MYELYLTCPRGLEQSLYDETRTIINQDITLDKGGIEFKGTLEDIYRIINGIFFFIGFIVVSL